jgi:hypothetical protein
LTNKQREVDELKRQLNAIIEVLQREIAGATDQAVLERLKLLGEIAANLPPDIAFNLHVRYLDRTITDIQGLAAAAVELESNVDRTKPIEDEMAEVIVHAIREGDGFDQLSEADITEFVKLCADNRMHLQEWLMLKPMWLKNL